MVYYMPWCRAGPWVMGIWLGYVLHKQGNKKFKMSGVSTFIVNDRKVVAAVVTIYLLLNIMLNQRIMWKRLDNDTDTGE